jgi:hypothetical protein
MEDNWNSYLCNIHESLGSIHLNLDLSKRFPCWKKQTVMGVSTSSSPDGLSSSDEARVLFKMEDKLNRSSNCMERGPSLVDIGNR